MNFKESQLSGTLDTAATELFDEAFEVVFAVVVGDFFAGFDSFLGHDEDAAATVDGFGVRSTGMVGVTSRVVARATIDVPLAVHVEHVAIVTLITLTGWNPFSDILDDGRALFYGRQSKEPESGFGTLHFYV